MDDWLKILIVVLVIGAIIGNLSMLKRSARPMRKKSLNDLQETLPRKGQKTPIKTDVTKDKTGVTLSNKKKTQ